MYLLNTRTVFFPLTSIGSMKWDPECNNYLYSSTSVLLISHVRHGKANKVSSCLLTVWMLSEDF